MKKLAKESAIDEREKWKEDKKRDKKCERELLALARKKQKKEEMQEERKIRRAMLLLGPVSVKEKKRKVNGSY